jgi:hypothetical protein
VQRVYFYFTRLGKCLKIALLLLQLNVLNILNLTKFDENTLQYYVAAFLSSILKLGTNPSVLAGSSVLLLVFYLKK